MPTAASPCRDGKASRYVGLGSRSEALLKDVLRLLGAFGIRGRIFRVTSNRQSSFTYTRMDGTTVAYESRQGFDLRITGTDLERFAAEIGFSAPRKDGRSTRCSQTTARYRTKPDVTLVSREDDGQEVVYNLTEPLHHSYIVDGFVVANCTEYMSIDDSACNLASLNLMKFRREDGELDVEAFEHAVDIVFLAQEILVGYSSLPDARDRAQREGLPAARARLREPRRAADGARAPVRLGRGPRVRGRDHRADDRPRATASRPRSPRGMGPFAGYRPNAAAMIGVIAKHRAAVGNIEDAHTSPPTCSARAARAWDDALDLGEVHGFRNAQATVLAPTGTISFMMDCDTTGVEPDFSLVKSKKLVGGGEITIVNKTVPMALEQARLRADRDRGGRRLHRRAQHDRRRAVREDRALPGLRLRDRRPRDPLHGPREDDGRGPAVHLRARSRRR